MKTTGTSSRSRPVLRLAAVGLGLLVPLLMGGCPEYRDDLVGVFETATREALLGTADEWTITYAIRGSVVDATIDLIFDQFRSDQN
jgi:hypothetical protein